MRTRRIENAVDAAPPPGRALSLHDELVEAGVPPGACAFVESLVWREAYGVASEAVRRLVLALGRSPAGKALQRVVLGDAGRSFEQDAREAGCDRANLARAEARIRAAVTRRIRKTGRQRPHR